LRMASVSLSRPIGAVCPYLVLVLDLSQHLVELLAVVNRGIPLGVAADQLVLEIDVLGPVRVLVLLRVLGRLLSHTSGVLL
jgi:hypothetical protein